MYLKEMDLSTSDSSVAESADIASGVSTEMREIMRKPSAVILSKDGQETDLRTILRNLVKKTSPIKTTPTEDKIIRAYDTIILFLCCLGIAVMMVQLLFFWDYQTGIYTTDVVQYLKLANIGVTGLLSFIFMALHTRLSYKLTKREWKGFPKVMKMKLSAVFYLKAIAKFVICAIQPLPFIRIDEIGVFMFLRLFAVIPVLRDYHPIYVYRREITKNKRFATTSSLHTFSSGTCLKAVFANHPIIAVSITVVCSFCIAAFCVYILERDHHTPEEDPDINYVYMALITITTVGYGDYSPNSPYGRAACVVTGFVGIITTAFFINMISSNLQLSPLQKEASDWTVQRHNVMTLHNKAATFIQLNWRHYIRILILAFEEELDMKNTRFNTVQAKMNAKAAHRQKATKYLKKLRNLRRKMTLNNMHSEDPVLDKILSMEQHISTIETQNKMLVAKLDYLSNLLVQSPLIMKQISSSTSNRQINQNSNGASVHFAEQ